MQTLASLRGAGLAWLVVSAVAGCAPAIRSTAAASLAPPQSAELWEEPGDLPTRDLKTGPGGEGLQPRADVDYAFKAYDTTGMSRGFDVIDPEGRGWDVKIGPEAQIEVVVSRLLWAVGFHQPRVYYVPSWRLTGWAGPRPGGGRFRLSSDHKIEAASWSWHQNPFVGTRELRGLLVANLLLNNWDLKDSQNRVYRVDESRPGPGRWFVVQDLGAALGKTRWPTGTKGVIDDFERMGFVRGVDGGRVKFAYSARHKELFADITPADVVWTCRLFDRLSEPQWRDAFAGAGYTDSVGRRYIAALRSRVAAGLALQAAP